MSLNQMIKDFQAEVLPSIPPDALQVMLQATDDLIASGIAAKAVQVGERAPDFSLAGTSGETVVLSALLNKGPVVLNFYRGAWCPYCNLELKALNDTLPAITALGASLVSISPNMLEKSAAIAAEKPFGFDILSDVDNRVAKEYRLVFTLAETLRPLYEDFGIDLAEFDGNKHFELPMPATYVVNTDGTIASGFVNEDYTLRMEPSDIIESLRKLFGQS